VAKIGLRAITRPAGLADLVDLEDLVAEVVDDLDGDLAGLGSGERPADRGVEARPGVLFDVGSTRAP
jgi:hypothetical protein